MSKEYFLGLDIGTSSLGWAVTDTNYKILRAKGKNLIGVRLFEEGKQQKKEGYLDLVEEEQQEEKKE